MAASVAAAVAVGSVPAVGSKRGLVRPRLVRLDCRGHGGLNKASSATVASIRSVPVGAIGAEPPHVDGYSPQAVAELPPSCSVSRMSLRLVHLSLERRDQGIDAVLGRHSLEHRLLFHVAQRKRRGE